jgi:hypothetical protein
MGTCDCSIVYEPVEVHVKALLATGAPNPSAVYYISNNIIDWDFSPEIEEGKRVVLRCGGNVKNVVQGKDVLTGGTLKLSFCCEDPELQHKFAGSIGMITYDSSSPPCAIGWNVPTPAQQAVSYDYEIRLYLKVMDGSNVEKYKELHFYDCRPAFFSEGGGQEEYAKHEISIKCVDNPNYTTAKGTFDWLNKTTIPTS